MEGINNIHWHDCEIESVVEIPSKDLLVLNVKYPEKWEENYFVPKGIVFEGYHSQEVNEIPFVGNPTILNVDILCEVDTPFQKEGYFKVKIETNAGDRFVVAKRVKLLNDQVSI